MGTVLAAVTLAAARARAANPGAPGRRIAAIGDSTCSGMDSTLIPWPQTMHNTANKRQPRGFVAGMGISGAAYSGISTKYADVVGRGFTDVILLGGVNDMLTGVTGATAFGNYNTGIVQDALLTRGMRVYWCTPLAFGSYSGWTAPIQTQMNTLLTSIRALSQNNLTIVETETLSDDGSGNMKTAWASTDGLHPGQAGADAIAAFVTSAMGL